MTMPAGCARASVFPAGRNIAEKAGAVSGLFYRYTATEKREYLPL